MNKVLRLAQNTKGRDLVVGDIHGMFSMLNEALKAIGFKPGIDRLISVGDLVDRGPESHVVADWLACDWFFTALGNHDAQYAMEARRALFQKEHGARAIDPASKYEWICNPFDTWYLDLLSNDERNAVFSALYHKTYPAIEIETAGGLVGVVHAAVPYGYNWESMRISMNNQDFGVIHRAIWERDFAYLAQDETPIDESLFAVPDVLHVFHGHTVHPDCIHYSLANRHHIDTGANMSRAPDKFPNAGFTIFDVTNPHTPLYYRSLAA